MRKAGAQATQVKVPVSDVWTAARWYARLLDMVLVMEFVEEDELRGVVLEEQQTRARIGLRDRDHASSHPVLSGFDLLNFEMVSLAALEALPRAVTGWGSTPPGFTTSRAGPVWTSRTRTERSFAFTSSPDVRRSSGSALTARVDTSPIPSPC